MCLCGEGQEVRGGRFDSHLDGDLAGGLEEGPDVHVPPQVSETRRNHLNPPPPPPPRKPQPPPRKPPVPDQAAAAAAQTARAGCAGPSGLPRPEMGGAQAETGRGGGAAPWARGRGRPGPSEGLCCHCKNYNDAVEIMQRRDPNYALWHLLAAAVAVLAHPREFTAIVFLQLNLLYTDYNFALWHLLAAVVAVLAHLGDEHARPPAGPLRKGVHQPAAAAAAAAAAAGL